MAAIAPVVLTLEFWAFVASVVSILLAVIAVTLSVLFFRWSIAAKNTAARSLERIEVLSKEMYGRTWSELERMTQWSRDLISKPEPPKDEEGLSGLQASLEEVKKLIPAPDREKGGRLLDEGLRAARDADITARLGRVSFGAKSIYLWLKPRGGEAEIGELCQELSSPLPAVLGFARELTVAGLVRATRKKGQGAAEKISIRLM